MFEEKEEEIKELLLAALRNSRLVSKSLEGQSNRLKRGVNPKEVATVLDALRIRFIRLIIGHIEEVIASDEWLKSVIDEEFAREKKEQEKLKEAFKRKLGE